MRVSRRQAFGAVLVGAAPREAALAEATPQEGAEGWRAVARAHGQNFDEERLKRLRTILASKGAQLETLRKFALNEQVEPTQGIGKR